MKEPILLPSAILEAIDGTGEKMIRIQADRESVTLHWNDGDTPRTETCNLTAMAPSLPRMSVPKTLQPVPQRFMMALREAARCAAREPGRYALHRVQVRGAAGEVIGTDALIAVRFEGFTLPFAEDLLVPAVPLFGLDVWNRPDAGLRVGRTRKSMVIVFGDLTVWLRIDNEGNYPNLERVIPKEEPIATVTLDSEDAAFLMERLSELPVSDERYRPVTLDIGPKKLAAIRAANNDGEAVVEAHLPRSTVKGEAACLALDRRYLNRLLTVQVHTWHLHRGDKPLVAVGDGVTVLVMPVDPALIVPPSPSVRVLAPDGSTAVIPARRTTVKNIDPPPLPTTAADGEPNDPLAEAEALRAALAESLQRLGRMVTALRSRRKEQKALTQVWSSLKNLQLGS